MMLDFFTVNVVRELIILMVFAIMAVFAISPKACLCLRYATLGFALISTGAFLIMLRGIIPDFFTIIVANGLAVAWSVMIWLAVCQLTHKKFPIKFVISTFFVFIFLMTYFTYIDFNTNARAEIYSIIVFTYSFGSLYYLYSEMRIAPMRTPLQILAIALSVLAFAMVARHVLLIMKNIPADIFSISHIHQIPSLIATLCVIATGLSFVLISKHLQRLQLTEYSVILEHEVEHLRQSQEGYAQQRKMEAIKTLAGGFAHEFNNRLAAIVSNLDLLDRLPKEKETFKAAAANSAFRAAEMIRSLNLFAQSKYGFPVLLDLNAILAEALPIFRDLLGDRISLVANLAAECPTTRIDQDNFGLAVRCLLQNAKFALPAGGTVTIRTENIEIEQSLPSEDSEIPAGRYVVVAISDDGCGMPPHVLERAFDPFFTTREVGEGSGLGLSVVYGITHQAGGGATIESKPEHGTTVRMLFPV